MLFQLHWQNPRSPSETVFVAQDESKSDDEIELMDKIFTAIIERRKGECPDGWMPMICTEDAECFVLAASKQEG